MKFEFDCLIMEVTRNYAGLTFSVELVHEADQGRMFALMGNELSKRKISCTLAIGKAKPRTTMIIDRWSEGMMTYCLPEDVAELEAMNAELLEAAESVVAIAKEAHAHWDADRDSRVGKILLALAGANEAYDNRIDWIHAAIAKAKGEGV